VRAVGLLNVKHWLWLELRTQIRLLSSLRYIGAGVIEAGVSAGLLSSYHTAALLQAGHADRATRLTAPPNTAF
jgi:hypothetical protein